MRNALRLLFVLACCMGARASAGEGTLAATVAWRGADPSFLEPDCELCGLCELHDFDIEGHPEIHGIGLADVVVTAEPLDREQLASVIASRGTDSSPYETSSLDWNLDRKARVRVATAFPGAPLALETERPLRFSQRGRLVAEVDAAAKTVTFPDEGVVDVTDDLGNVGWVYVTRLPAKISAGNCRIVFNPLPIGSYRLRGWHPRGGERSRVVKINAKHAVLYLLIFGEPSRRR